MTSLSQQDVASAAHALRHCFTKAENELLRANSRIETSSGDAALNPARLLQRLSLVEDRVAALRSRTGKVAAARRDVVGPLQTLIAENRVTATALAARAEPGMLVAQVAPKPKAAADAAAEPVVEPAAQESSRSLGDLVSELRWLRLPSEARAGISFAEASAFWDVLQACAAKRGSTELQAAHLMASGAPMNERNQRAVRALERLELIGRKGNSIQLKQ
jgi:hypothetical protein